jgi:signal transduction histidine kinase/ligand-binding sensor domain-containing protein
MNIKSNSRNFRRKLSILEKVPFKCLFTSENILTNKSIIYLAIFLIPILFYSVSAQEIDIKGVSMAFKENPNIIIGMTQGHYGYIWMAGNEKGLFRYDGNNLKHYKNQSGNPNSLVSNRLECITTASDGTIWIGTFSSGLVHFNPGNETFITYQHDVNDPESIRSNNIRALAVDEKGGVWIGTSKGLDHFDPVKGEFQHTFTHDPDEDFLQIEHIRSLYIDKEDILWVGCGSAFLNEPTEGGLFKLDAENKSVDRYLHNSSLNSLVDNRIKAIYEDSKGNFWVGSAGDGLHTMNRKEGTFVRHNFDPDHPEKLSRPPLKDLYNFADDHIVFIAEDNQGFLWIATFEGGINRYDPVNESVQHFGTNEEGIFHIPRDDFWCGLLTDDNQLWFSTWDHTSYNDQLLKINPNSKQLTRISLNRPVFSFAQDEDKSIYLGSPSEIIKMDTSGNMKTIFQFREEDPNLRITDIDEQGNLWVSSNFGLHYYSPHTGMLKSYNLNQYPELVATRIWNTCILNKDSVLVGTPQGLYLLDRIRNRFIKYPLTDPLTKAHRNDGISRIHRDTQNNIWIGTRNMGLHRMPIESGKSIAYRLRDVTAEIIYDIHENPAIGLFVSTWRSGLRKYNATNDQFESIIDDTGLLNSETIIYSIHSSGANQLWLESQDGIIKYDIPNKTASIYGNSWGFNSSIITNIGFFRSWDGTFYMGTVDGFIKFHPSDFDYADYKPAKPFIEKIWVDNEIYTSSNDSTDKLELSYNHSNISMELSYINFLSDASDQYIQYKLDGYDSDWRNVESGERIYLYKIPPGNYTFRLKAMDLYGDWNETSLYINVTPPWYRTWLAYISYGLLFITGIFVTDRVQRRRLLEKERKRAKEKELEQAREIKKAYNDLRATQDQLIQAEKMASLGELTAGIAHEIQNPLNFVNNFSEVNNELIEELEMESFKPSEKKDEQVIKDLILNIKKNELKIKQHGRRAEGIVKGMLMHSRSSKREKEFTDINAMGEEYLRLAYHGFRAKDKSFNADFKMDVDKKLPKIKVITQDVGRVFLNLINNAFYAVDKKAREGNTGYKPEVIFNTRQLDGKIEIRVCDNGSGIPAKIKDKIFQPFFTTKPTGKGTGLGLSLSYDIITKGHNGHLEVDTQVGIGTEFIIQIPIT